jgi:3-phenylpropionate/trans-cinnamate dioxygenase ferredoxin subunit
MDIKYQWIKIAANIHEIEFAKNNIAKINIGEKSICLIRTMNGLKACASKCPHAGGDLSIAYLDNKENIICPVHNYRFNLNNGSDTFGEGYFLKVYKVVSNDDGIFVGLEKW